MRRIITISILAIIVLVAGFFVFRYAWNEWQYRTPYDAVPESSVLIFEFMDVDEAFTHIDSAAYADDLKKAGFVGEMMSSYQVIDSFFTAMGYDERQVELASLHVKGDQISYVWLLDRGRQEAEEVWAAIEEQDGSEISIKRRQFKDEPLFEARIKWDSVTITCSYQRGIFIASMDASLVEEAIEQINDGTSLLKDKAFKDVKELVSPNTDMTMYFDFARLARFENLLVNGDKPHVFNQLKNFSGWTELDFNFKESSILINGFTRLPDGSTSQLSAFKNSAKGKFDMAEVLPENVAIFYYMDFGKLNVGLKNDAYILNKYFDKWAGSSICYGLLEPFEAIYDDRQFMIVEVDDYDEARNRLGKMAEFYSEGANIARFKGQNITQVMIGDKLNTFLKSELIPLNNPYFAYLGDKYVVFANEVAAIKVIIQDYANGATLGRNLDYQTFTTKLSTSSNFYMYINPTRLKMLFYGLLSNTMVELMEAGEDSYKSFSPIAFQFSKDGNFFFTNGYITYGTQIEQRTNQLWRAQLDTTALSKPYLVTNHNTQEKEVIIQDVANNIYLIDRAGKVLWKKSINGPIESDIQEIDVYKNDKVQYLFSTSSEIYVVDRNGDDVDNYPLKIPASASNGITLVEYDNKKDYRLFVGTSNYKIYGYKTNGSPLTGWRPRGQTGTVVHPMQHIVISNKDYLITHNVSGTLLFMNRKGKERVKPIRMGTQFTQPFYAKVRDKSFELVNVDTSGNLYRVTQSGSTSKKKLTAIQDYYAADIAQMAGDEMLVLTDSFRLNIKNLTQNQDFTYPSPNTIDLPAFWTDEGQIGIVSRQENLINMIDYYGTPNSDFPLQGNTPFIIADLFDNEEKVLLVGDQEGYLNAYRIR